MEKMIRKWFGREIVRIFVESTDKNYLFLVIANAPSTAKHNFMEKTPDELI